VLVAPTVIVVPCYNEAARLPVADFHAYLSDPDAAHLLFVDDGSKDATRDLLLTLCSRFPGRCSAAALTANAGKAEAVRVGLVQAIERGAAHIGYWDADLATPLDEIADFEAVLHRRHDVGVVLGSRRPMLGRNIQRDALRALLGSGCRTAVRRVLRAGVYDTQCGAKLFRTSESLRRCLAWPFASRWMFDVELLLRLQRLSTTDAGGWFEQPLHHWSEKAGSKIKPGDYWRALGDLRRLSRAYANTKTAIQTELDGHMQPRRTAIELTSLSQKTKRAA
jgi:glycosyltransferase involved in cell wall biosynthesis